MTSILFIGLLGVLFVIVFKRPILGNLGRNNKWVHKLKNVKWFQNHWLAGLFLFVMNAVLFLLTGIVLRILGYFVIPYVHLLIMFLAVIGSIYLWGLIHNAWEGSKRNRMKLGALGSSFYMLLTFTFVYWFVTLKPSYPGEDTFMRAISLLFAIIVAAVAFITCFIMTGFSKKKEAI